jgi:hypothetical protein
MSGTISDKKKEFGQALLHYFNGNPTKVKRFTNQLRILGLDLDNEQVLDGISQRSEAVIVLLGLSNFGVLTTVCKSLMHIQGTGDVGEYIKQHSERLASMPRPK